MHAMSSTNNGMDPMESMKAQSIPDLGAIPQRSINLKAVAFVGLCVLLMAGMLWYFFKSGPKSEAPVANDQQLATLPAPPARAPASSARDPATGAVAPTRDGSQDLIELVNKRKGYFVGADGKEIKIDSKETSVVSNSTNSLGVASAGASGTSLPEGDSRRLFYVRHGSAADTSGIGLDGGGQTQDLVKRRANSSGEVSIMVGGQFLSAGGTSTVQHASAERAQTSAVSLERRSTSAYSSGNSGSPDRKSVV